MEIFYFKLYRKHLSIFYICLFSARNRLILILIRVKDGIILSFTIKNGLFR